MPSILLLEINEIPSRVIDLYGNDPRYPHIAAFIKNCKQTTTIAIDEGELSPWITWPTIHRGMDKSGHLIQHLGQDPRTFKGEPVWNEFRKRGKNIGIFGSLQSWPPEAPGEGGFYLPDTFSQSAACIPDWLTPLQEFNLDQVKTNGRMMGKMRLLGALNPRLMRAMWKARIKPRTFLMAVSQLMQEKFDPRKKERRATFQAMFFWDIFCAIFDPKNPPAFTSFFTNHIASVMHRFWNHIFPDDFPSELRPENPYHKKTMDFAMGLLDKILAKVNSWQKDNPDLIVIMASSMGQSAIIRKHDNKELLLKQPNVLLKKIGVTEEIKQNLAMVPQTAYEIADAKLRKKIMNNLLEIKNPSGSSVFSAEEIGHSISITTITPGENDLAGEVALIGEKRIPYLELGLFTAKVDPGTAYHIPEGIFFVSAGNHPISLPSKPIPADQVKKLLMSWGGLV